MMQYFCSTTRRENRHKASYVSVLETLNTSKKTSQNVHFIKFPFLNRDSKNYRNQGSDIAPLAGQIFLSIMTLSSITSLDTPPSEICNVQDAVLKLSPSPPIHSRVT